jgi:hypothetical protein
MQVGFHPGNEVIFNGVVSSVPIPAAAWLFGSGLLGLFGFSHRRVINIL